MVIDGLGTSLLRENAASAPFLSSLPGIDDVVCGVPSTTATSLTSLGTGLRAGEHGMVGYTSRVPATGERLNSLTVGPAGRAGAVAAAPHRARADPGRRIRGVLGQPRQVRRVRAHPVQPARRAVPRRHVHLGAARRRGRGHRVRTAWRRLRLRVAARPHRPRQGMHVRRSGARRSPAVDSDVAAMRAALPADTVLLVTADHGMVDLPQDDRFDLDQHPSLREDVVMVAGEARFRHLYTRSGAEDAVADRWRQRGGGAGRRQHAGRPRRLVRPDRPGGARPHRRRRGGVARRLRRVLLGRTSRSR